MSAPASLNAPALLAAYQQDMEAEAARIADFWLTNAVDERRGGFIGRMDSAGRIDPNAGKGSVLNARILWTFSALYRHTGRVEYRPAATRAYQYLRTHFLNQEYGGLHWLVNAQGQPQDSRQQVYALAFAIYGLSEYYRATQEPGALQASQQLFEWMEAHSYDAEHGGYFEALAPTGEQLDDQRLSDKDLNAPKTMNTHLHILEAYANLYHIWPEARLAERLRHLLQVFETHIVDAEAGHLRLFFARDWTPVADLVSYGHDIEAAWLLPEAAEALGDAALLARTNALAQRLARAAAAALLPDGSLPHELNRATQHQDLHREWWVSAEAMVGFLHAYELTHDEAMLHRSNGAWRFAQQHLLDLESGEWRWGVYDDYQPMREHDKIGFWKCPYHNVRACLEVSRRCKNQLLHFEAAKRDLKLLKTA
ncbi:AGE family epimerase/isomerase [Hymenobacter convexus]|uniref:AGE family epimerase/isomerase n=1 Tax=Hymenobacter sp. CA1UV-4 TaxID=3063782 RepID=UPI002712E3F0|nr:AGE family epimerase/isomerase [Hymenobacter sp. CA1UV-4]MDO7850416.1 AGE family epimerase/isomerase [Hymenobacter sp. CA1UV-4]